MFQITATATHTANRANFYTAGQSISITRRALPSGGTRVRISVRTRTSGGQLLKRSGWRDYTTRDAANKEFDRQVSRYLEYHNAVEAMALAA